MSTAKLMWTHRLRQARTGPAFQFRVLTGFLSAKEWISDSCACSWALFLWVCLVQWWCVSFCFISLHFILLLKKKSQCRFWEEHKEFWINLWLLFCRNLADFLAICKSPAEIQIFKIFCGNSQFLKYADSDPLMTKKHQVTKVHKTKEK